MLEKITLDGSNVTAQMDALIHYYDIGYDGVYKYGQMLKANIVTNNLIKISDGLMMIQGRYMRVVNGSYEEITIENGVTGVNRTDLIVAHFETDGINETMDIRVLKGTPNGSAPTPTVGNTFEGAQVNELPLYAVKLQGINITSVERQFSYILSRKDIENALIDIAKAMPLWKEGNAPTLLDKLNPNK